MKLLKPIKDAAKIKKFKKSVGFLKGKLDAMDLLKKL